MFPRELPIDTSAGQSSSNLGNIRRQSERAGLQRG
jgi:hypothetical protein